MSDDKSMQREEGQEGKEQEQQHPQQLAEGMEGSGSLEMVAREETSEGQHESMFGKSLRNISMKLSNFAG